MFQKEMFIDINIFVLALVVILFIGAKSFVKFGRVHDGEHPCEIISNLESDNCRRNT